MSLQHVTTGENWGKGHRISQYYFLKLHMNVQLSQNKKLNLKKVENSFLCLITDLLICYMIQAKGGQFLLYKTEGDSREWTYGCQGEGIWFGSLGLTCTHCYVKKNLLYNTWNCSMSCGSLDGKGIWGRMDTCVYTAESLLCLSETIIILLISCTPTQNLKFFLKENKSVFIYLLNHNNNTNESRK